MVMTETENLGKLGAVLLAAGSSSRLGQAKQLLHIDGETLVTRMARRLIELGPANVIVVTGSASQAVNDQLSGLPVHIVHNACWEEGMASSLSAGVENLPAEIEGVLIMLCDQWQVGLPDLQALVQAWFVDISVITAASWITEERHIIGPPAIFPRNLFHELICLKGDRGARAVIEKYRERTSLLAMDRARFDLDEPKDLAAFQNRQGND
jgi:molybdenum cofactor cytidylyltransferase